MASEKHTIDYDGYRLDFELDESTFGSGLELNVWISHDEVDDVLEFKRLKVDPELDRPPNMVEKVMAKATGKEPKPPMTVQEQVDQNIEDVKEFIDEEGERLIREKKEKKERLNSYLPGDMARSYRSVGKMGISYGSVPQEAQDEDFESMDGELSAFLVRSNEEDGRVNRTLLPKENEPLLDEDAVDEKVEVTFGQVHHAAKLIEAMAGNKSEKEPDYSEVDCALEVLELFDNHFEEDRSEEETIEELEDLVQKVKHNFPEESSA